MLKPKPQAHSAPHSAAALSRPANRPINFQIGDGQGALATEGRPGSSTRNILGLPHARLQGEPSATEFVDGDRRRGRGTVTNRSGRYEPQTAGGRG